MKTKATIAEIVSKQIEDMIAEGSLQQGARLPSERILAERLEVSRPTLREAKQILTSKGLLKSHQGGGTYVTSALNSSISDPLMNLLKERPEFKFEPPKFKSKPTTIEFPSIGSLPCDHHARLFYSGRKMPNDFLDKVFYADDFREWAISVSEIDYSNLGREESRMVIPFFDTEGKLIAAQGRALGSHELRYITIKVSEDSPKVYGLERWKSEDTTYIVEGPIDSMFLPNCLAVAGGDLQSIKLDKKQCVLIFDNEPRNEHTVKKLMKAIDDGWSVVVWSKEKKFKDINDLIMSGLSTDEILEMINKNTMNGLKADWAAREWRNVH